MAKSEEINPCEFPEKKCDIACFEACRICLKTFGSACDSAK